MSSNNNYNNSNSDDSESVPDFSKPPQRSQPAERPTAYSTQGEKMQAYRQVHYANQPTDPYTGARASPNPSQHTQQNTYPAQYPAFNDGTTFQPGQTQYPQQYQGGQPQQQHYNQQYQYQPQYQGQGQGQYNPQQYQQYQQQQQYYQGYPPQGQQSQNNPYPRQRNERGFFSNLFDAFFVGALGVVTVEPWVAARRMLSIKPETSPQEKAERYAYALPQLLREKGVGSLWAGYKTSLLKAPAIALDLLIFHTMKGSAYPHSWLSNVFLASQAAAFSYFLYQPIWSSMKNMIFSQGGNYKDYYYDIKNTVRNNYQNHGFRGLYPNMIANLPYIMLFKGIQLGTIDRSMTTMRYNEGNTSLFRKFLVCYSITIIARFVTYPLELAKSKVSDSGSAFSTVKNLVSETQRVVRTGEWNFRKATSRSFQASSSCLAFAMFYHLRDENLPRY